MRASLHATLEHVLAHNTHPKINLFINLINQNTQTTTTTTLMNHEESNSNEERINLRVEEVLEDTDDNEAIYVPGSDEEDAYYARLVNVIDGVTDQTGLWGTDWDYQEPITEAERRHLQIESYGDYDLNGHFVCGYCISAYYLDACRGDGTLNEYRDAVQRGDLLDISMIPLTDCTCQDSDDADPDWSPMEVDTTESYHSEDDPTLG